MTAEALTSTASVGVAIVALVFTSVLLARQVQQMEHERNALAILEAIERLTDPQVLEIFNRLRDVNARYPTDEELIKNYRGSADEGDFLTIGSFVETVACLARRRVLDPSLIVDAVGLSIRMRWDSINEFVQRRRRVESNAYILENFEWLAMYSAWWKDTPRPPRDRNYHANQFSGIAFRV